jgi:hypothetical protein
MFNPRRHAAQLRSGAIFETLHGIWSEETWSGRHARIRPGWRREDRGSCRC